MKIKERLMKEMCSELFRGLDYKVFTMTMEAFPVFFQKCYEAFIENDMTVSVSIDCPTIKELLKNVSNSESQAALIHSLNIVALDKDENKTIAYEFSIDNDCNICGLLMINSDAFYNADDMLVLIDYVMFDGTNATTAIYNTNTIEPMYLDDIEEESKRVEEYNDEEPKTLRDIDDDTISKLTSKVYAGIKGVAMNCKFYDTLNKDKVEESLKFAADEIVKFMLNSSKYIKDVNYHRVDMGNMTAMPTDVISDAHRIKHAEHIIYIIPIGEWMYV